MSIVGLYFSFVGKANMVQYKIENLIERVDLVQKGDGDMFPPSEENGSIIYIKVKNIRKECYVECRIIIMIGPAERRPMLSQSTTGFDSG